MRKRPRRGVSGGGSHIAVSRDWLPPVSAGQSVYSPYRKHLLPITGYQGGSHFLATNWLPVETDISGSKSGRGGTVYHVLDEEAPFENVETIEWE